MGGAGFPTCVKLKPAKPVDTILLNGCECEPYLTADHKVLLEFADDIIFGLKAVLKTTGADLSQEPNTRRVLRKLSLSALWEERFRAAVSRQMLALS